MEKEILKKYNYWLENLKSNQDLLKELEKMSEEEIYEAFYKELGFGTAGIRGILGVGTNRMNVFIIRKATQALANYLKKNVKGVAKVAIAYDSRNKSDEFAKEASTVLANNGIDVYLFDKIMPVPVLSFTIRELNCDAGIVITASHNPSKYNGYKVYGNDGSQITSLIADKIVEEIEKLDVFKIEAGDFISLKNEGKIKLIGDEILSKFLEKVKECSVIKNKEIDRNVSIVYTPLNGAGLIPVTRILKETGFTNVKVVKEQEKPDGNFPTCPYPNPEIKEAMELGIRDAKKYNADLLIATDPDCDRCGIAVKENNNYKLLTGNQTGILLFNYICENRVMPKHPQAAKTIVSSEMIDAIADHYKVSLYKVLTGFKYIGDFIKNLEAKHEENNFIFGYEESYGYLTGTHSRDKDAVNASFMIAEMFAFYKSKGVSLLEKLDELYIKFGYYLDKQVSFVFEGSKGVLKMEEISNKMKAGLKQIGGYKVVKILDYSKGIDNLPKSNVVKMYLENGSTVIMRPSGTEPKYKVYYGIKGSSKEEANEILLKLESSINKEMK